MVIWNEKVWQKRNRKKVEQKKKEIMEHLGSLIPEDFKCDHISVTFPNYDTVRIELKNDYTQKLVSVKGIDGDGE